ncbi:hypothetical protein K438DRAFT_1934075 [Mycena galopus ATCC 62051]|nr:hypothetical protein K438DRAFT_1934075 [Mycena galopus ATCC 62051]
MPWSCELGFMHHWLLGVLEHQLHVLWGIGHNAQRTKNLAEFDADDDDLWTDDISEAGGDADAQDVLDNEANFNPDQFAKWREEYLEATQAEDDDMTPTGTPAPDIDDPMDDDNEGNKDDEFADIGGPLASQNEFMGECVNGILQKIKINDHYYDMDYARLRHFVRLGHLLARKHDKHLQNGNNAALQDFDNILDPTNPKTLQTPTKLDGENLAKFLAKKSHDISKPLYTLILEYLGLVVEHKFNFYGTRNAAGTITLPDLDHGSMILPPRGKWCQKFHVDKRTYSRSSSYAANSLIQFYEPGIDLQETSTEVIIAILQIPLDNILRTFVLVPPVSPT